MLRRPRLIFNCRSVWWRVVQTCTDVLIFPALYSYWCTSMLILFAEASPHNLYTPDNHHISGCVSRVLRSYWWDNDPQTGMPLYIAYLQSQASIFMAHCSHSATVLHHEHPIPHTYETRSHISYARICVSATSRIHTPWWFGMFEHHNKPLYQAAAAAPLMCLSLACLTP